MCTWVYCIYTRVLGGLDNGTLVIHCPDSRYSIIMMIVHVLFYYRDSNMINRFFQFVGYA